MSFQWLEMRISEEIDRRKREAGIMERLPRALEEFHDALAECIESYRQTFGADTADIQMAGSRIRISVRNGQPGKQPSASVDVAALPEIPGFEVDKGGGEALIIEVGLLPGDKVSYRDRAKDEYVTMDELTRRTLDRALFPQLKE